MVRFAVGGQASRSVGDGLVFVTYEIVRDA
jgi:hypothetical protein